MTAAGVDARYCRPFEADGVCDKCLRYSPYCLYRMVAVTITMICRKCRGLA